MSMGPRCKCLLSILALFALAGLSWAGSSAFDLPGPRVAVKVTRSGQTLPISQVVNLQPKDRVWVHAELPPEQSVHYLLVAVFLRGATNPPPENWFIKAETWKKQIREEGMVITVPEEAQQLLLFLAPETGGDFGTLRSAVRGKPGAFERAARDLNRASMDRSRLDAYLEAVHKTSETEHEALHERSVLLARSLNIKVDQECFDKPTEQQASCLTQNTDQLVLEDGHGESMVNALTSGPSSDLIGQITTTRVAGGGMYSAYVGAVVDLARVFENIHTAEYQYIPALAVPKHDELNLKLNNPPSFHKPMSVLVIGLPGIEAAQPPPMRAVNTAEVYCLQKPSLVLPVEGAPLVYSTSMAHDFYLQLKGKSGQTVDLPAKADPARGGFVMDMHKLRSSPLETDLTGTLHGYWGFKPFDGPGFHIRNPRPTAWTVPAADHTALIVGRNDVVHLHADDASCVDDIVVKTRQGREIKTTWKQVKPGELEVQVPLTNEPAGPVTALVKQYGLAEPDQVALQTYSEAAHLDDFQLNAGDREGVLRGTRLDEVASLELKGARFVPGTLSRSGEKDELHMLGPDNAGTFQAGETLTAHVTVKDGRTLDIQTHIEAPRPRVSLVSKNIDPGPSAAAIRLGSQDELPHDGRVSFFLKSEVPAAFPRSGKIEVANEDESLHTVLSLDDGSLILEDSQSVLAQFEPLKSFGPSAFGPLRFRVVQSDGLTGDWQPLAKLVRVPALTEVRCSSNPDEACTLEGSKLFLIDSVASNPEFTDSVSIPLGLVDSTVPVPRPNGPMLYIKLRDDPAVVSTATLPGAPRPTNSSAERPRKRYEAVN